jgi:hypothetical protein
MPEDELEEEFAMGWNERRVQHKAFRLSRQVISAFPIDALAHAISLDAA